MLYHTAVIGAGAAGLFCAARIANTQQQVIVIDHAEKIGEKIRISGGGRCNFTNLNIHADNFLSANPHFVRSALARYGASDFIKLVEEYGIAYYEKELGQLFTRDGAQQIVDLLLSECSNNDVTIENPVHVNAITRNDNCYQIKTRDRTITARNIVIATGGLSIPKVGASDFGYRIAKQFGHTTVEPRPALVALTLEKAHQPPFNNLAGTSLVSRVGVKKQQFANQLLFTHQGLSGPAILQISSYWQQSRRQNPASSIDISFVDMDVLDRWREEYSRSNTTLGNALSSIVPKRFAERIVSALDANPAMSQLSKTHWQQLTQLLTSYSLKPDGTAGFQKAEVTLGGVCCDELSSKSLESRLRPGLFFIGEVVDVTGHLGGYNFQWAWSSAAAAAEELGYRYY